MLLRRVIPRQVTLTRGLPSLTMPRQTMAGLGVRLETGAKPDSPDKAVLRRDMPSISLRVAFQ